MLLLQLLAVLLCGQQLQLPWVLDWLALELLLLLLLSVLLCMLRRCGFLGR